MQDVSVLPDWAGADTAPAYSKRSPTLSRNG